MYAPDMTFENNLSKHAWTQRYGSSTTELQAHNSTDVSSALQGSEELQALFDLLSSDVRVLVCRATAGFAQDHQGGGGWLHRGTMAGVWETEAQLEPGQPVCKLVQYGNSSGS